MIVDATASHVNARGNSVMVSPLCRSSRHGMPRRSPAPIGSTGGIEIGSRAVIGRVPTIARAAARCDDGVPPQAIAYDPTDGV